MISKDCSIVTFVNAVVGKDYAAIIELADREATFAERGRYRRSEGPADDSTCGRCYPGQLKDLIFYLRYNIRPAKTTPEHLKLYQELVDVEQARTFQVEFRSLGHSIYHLPLKPRTF